MRQDDARRIMDSGLSGSDLATALALWSYADDAGRCWPSVSSLCRRSGCGERTVRRALRRLEAAGLLASVWTGRQTPTYRLTLDALPPADTSSGEDAGGPDLPGGATVAPGVPPYEEDTGARLAPPATVAPVVETQGGQIGPRGGQIGRGGGHCGPQTHQEPTRNPPSSSRAPSSSSHLQGGSVPGANSKPNPSTPPQEEDDLDWLDSVAAGLDADREAASLAALEASAAAMGARSTLAPRVAAPPDPPAAPPNPPAVSPTASAAPALTPTDSAPPPGPTVAETIDRLKAAAPHQREEGLGLALLAAVARRARAADAGPDWSTLPPLGERRPLPPRARFAAPPLEHDEAAQLWRAAADHRWRWSQASAAVLRLVDRAGLDALRVRLAWVAERHDALGVAPDWGRVMACA